MQRTPGRTITILAVGFLGLDGVLLMLAGLWSARMGLVVWGVIFSLGAGLVVRYWKRYVRTLEELGQDLQTRFQELHQIEVGAKKNRRD